MNRSLIILLEQNVYGVVKFDWLSLPWDNLLWWVLPLTISGLPLYCCHGQGHNREVAYKRQESNIDRSLSGVRLVGCLGVHHYCIASVGLVPAPLNFLHMVPSARLLCLDTHPTVLRPLTRFYSFITLRNKHPCNCPDWNLYFSVNSFPVILEGVPTFTFSNSAWSIQTTVQLGRWSVHNTIIEFCDFVLFLSHSQGVRSISLHNAAPHKIRITSGTSEQLPVILQ